MSDIVSRGIEFAILVALTATATDAVRGRPFLWWAGRWWLLSLCALVILILALGGNGAHPVTRLFWDW